MTRGTRAVPLVFVLFVWTLTTHGKFSDSGDEPHYLMVAESLWSDNDLDLANNYARGDGRWFGADTLEAGPHARVTTTGATWSTHDVGLPLLILPVYAAATRLALAVPDPVLTAIKQPRGLFAYSLVSLSLTALTACGLALLVSALSRVTSATPAALTGLVLGLSPPVLSHAFLVFPETPAFVVVCACVWLACLRRSEVTVTRAASFAIMVGALPWLHRKYSFFVLGLIVLLVSRHRGWLREQPRRVWWGLAALVLLPQAALHVWTFAAWGNLGGPQMLDALPFSMAGVQRGALGLLFDRERGLAGYAPVWLLLPLCWTLTWPAYRIWLVPVACLFLPMAAFAVWSAGFSPAARYLVPLMPLLAAPVAGALRSPIVRLAGIPFLAFQALVTAVVWSYPRALWPREQGSNDALQRIPWIGPAYERMLPSLFTGDSVAWGWLALTTVAGGTALLTWTGRRMRPTAGTSAPAT